MKKKFYTITFSLLLISASFLVSADNLSPLNVYLHDHGYDLNPVNSIVNEGYMSDTQKEQFIDKLAAYENIKTIAEIGLNGGHSAEMFFNTCKNLELFASFDINHHPYTQVAVDYFYNTFGNRFLFRSGDSLKTVPQLHIDRPDLRFDLIFIDGCHHIEWAMGDILNMRNMAHSKTILWIDDVDAQFSGPVGQAAKACAEQGLIRLIKVHESQHPTQYGRSWLEAEYIFP